jgi:polyisoprenoid-binding protein YceI
MKKITLSFVASLITIYTIAQTTTWSLDKAHSKLGFSVTHLLVSDVDGNFKSFDAKITTTKEDFSDATVELTSDINSIDTDNEQRDGHLKSADFFDAAKYGSLTFKSKSFKKIDSKKYNVTGDLTLHGVTKPAELEITLRGTTVHPYTKKTVGGFKATGTLKRSDFGIGASTPGSVVSDEVAIYANAEFTKD